MMPVLLCDPMQLGAVDEDRVSCAHPTGLFLRIQQTPVLFFLARPTG